MSGFEKGGHNTNWDPITADKNSYEQRRQKRKENQTKSPLNGADLRPKNKGGGHGRMPTRFRIKRGF